MKLVIDQENELGSAKSALEKAESELRSLQQQWKAREDNEKLQTKSKAEALSKALVDSWSASLPADMMTDENKKAIYAMASEFPGAVREDDGDCAQKLRKSTNRTLPS